MASALFLHSRVEILAIFQADNTPLRADDIAHAIGSYGQQAYVFLESMREAGEIDRKPLRPRHTRRWIYFATPRGRRVNLAAARAALPRRAERGLDHHALSAALGIPAQPPGIPFPSWVTVHPLR